MWRTKALRTTRWQKLVANKAILAYILKYTMDDFEDTPLDEIPKYIEGKPKISQITVMQDHANIEDPEDSEGGTGSKHSENSGHRR